MKVTLIGAGNVGHHLAIKLHDLGLQIHQVFSRKRSNARRLAERVMALPCHELDELSSAADLFIIAVKDDAILSVIRKLPAKIKKEKLVVHTSGGTPTQPMGAYLQHFGSFYPLQTFSITKEPDWQTIPFCIDGNSKKSIHILENLASKITSKTYLIDDRQRAVLHVAAVFVNNFTNHLLSIGAQILEEEQLPFDILQPLIQETVMKLQSGSPKEMQTGPAIRNDEKTLTLHLNYLEKHPSFKKLYEDLTASIQQS